MSTGIAFFAYNTENIDYIKLSIIAARYVRRYMPDRNICLITDSGTWEWFNTSPYSKYIESAFDDVTLIETTHQINIRTHHDSPYHRFKSNFKNGNKHKIIEYTPYDKTLLLDIDYIVQNHSLDYVFGSDSAVSLFHNAESLTGLQPISSQKYLSDAGIPIF
jgi:hypothetical protein